MARLEQQRNNTMSFKSEKNTEEIAITDMEIWCNIVKRAVVTTNDVIADVLSMKR